MMMTKLSAVAIAVMLAGAGGWASGRDQDRAPAPSQQPVPDNSSVSPAARKSWEDFWKRLPKAKADALEKELNTLEARQRRGEPIERDLERVHHAYSELKGLSEGLGPMRWTVSSGGGTQTVTCTGLGWIGRNGRLRCIGRLTT